jgi:F-type H+-transporting ATPase subunit alpha
VVASLNQPQYAPWPVGEQVVVLWSVTNGYVDSIPVEEVSRFNEELVESLRAEGSILKAIEESKDLSDETVEALRKHLDSFKDSFFVEGDQDQAGAAA